MRWGATIAIAALTALALAANAQTPPPSRVAPGDFDFYVFTLSWSPGLCDTGGAASSPEQCAIGSGQGFVVHGLWPDNRYADDPVDCGPTSASSEALRMAASVYPSEGLARYEYAKHGTCTGYAPESYFQAAKHLREQIVTPNALRTPRAALRLSPEEIESAFMASNVNLHADNMAVTCSGGELIDLRFCISKNLKAYAVCPPKVFERSCRALQLTIAPLR